MKRRRRIGVGSIERRKNEKTRNDVGWWLRVIGSVNGFLPASLTLSTLCCERGGAALSGPGVPPTEPGDRVSSLPGPEYDSDDDGGRCQCRRQPSRRTNEK